MLKRICSMGLVLLFAACNGGTPDSELVAKVNGEGITKKEFDAAVERNMARYKGQSQQLPPGIETRIKESVLRRMIDDKVIEQKAKGLSVDVPADELEAKFKEHKDRFRTEEAFNDYLKRSGNTLENMKDDLKRNLLRDRVVEKLSGTVDVADEEIGKYYTDNVQRFTEKEQVKASRILVRFAPNATDADKKKAMKEAKDLRAKATKKDADFAAIAKDNSKGPEASRGGDLGWLTRGRMTPEFDNVAFTLAPNAVSDVIDSKIGYEVVKVFEKKAERQRPLDEVKDSIKNSLLARKRNEKRREVLRTLKADAKVEQLVQFEQKPGEGAVPAPQVARPGPDGKLELPTPGGVPHGQPAPVDGAPIAAPGDAPAPAPMDKAPEAAPH